MFGWQYHHLLKSITIWSKVSPFGCEYQHLVAIINILIWSQPRLVSTVEISCLYTSCNSYRQKYQHLVASIDILIWSQLQLIWTVQTTLPTSYNNDPSKRIDVWLTVPPFGQKHHYLVASIDISDLITTSIGTESWDLMHTY